jgi:hypothetical protein
VNSSGRFTVEQKKGWSPITGIDTWKRTGCFTVEREV